MARGLLIRRIMPRQSITIVLLITFILTLAPTGHATGLCEKLLGWMPLMKRAAHFRQVEALRGQEGLNVELSNRVTRWALASFGDDGKSPFHVLVYEDSAPGLDTSIRWSNGVLQLREHVIRELEDDDELATLVGLYRLRSARGLPERPDHDQLQQLAAALRAKLSLLGYATRSLFAVISRLPKSPEVRTVQYVIERAIELGTSPPSQKRQMPKVDAMESLWPYLFEKDFDLIPLPDEHVPAQAVLRTTRTLTDSFQRLQSAVSGPLLLMAGHEDRGPVKSEVLTVWNQRTGRALGYVEYVVSGHEDTELIIFSVNSFAQEIGVSRYLLAEVEARHPQINTLIASLAEENAYALTQAMRNGFTCLEAVRMTPLYKIARFIGLSELRPEDDLCYEKQSQFPHFRFYRPK